MEKIYTTDEARAFLKVSYPTIRRYILSGKLKAQKLGRQWRIPESALKEFLDSYNGTGGQADE